MSGETRDQRHYFVVSPEIMLDPGCSHCYIPTPPEYGFCYVEVLATSKRDAIRQAVGTGEFRRWVDERRSDGRTPFGGLKAELTVCEHGVCWGCAADGCADCADSDLEWMADDLIAFNARFEGATS